MGLRKSIGANKLSNLSFNSIQLLSRPQKVVTNWNHFISEASMIIKPSILALFSKSILMVLISICFSSLGFSYEKKSGFVEVEPGRSLYYEWEIKSPKYETLILLNGLTYSTKHWDDFVKATSKYNFNILRYDPKGMGETLLKEGPPASAIRVEDQAQDLFVLTSKLEIKKPLNLLGLSYGGGLALVFTQKFPDSVNKLILMSPYTEAMESQDKIIRLQMATTRATNPFMKVTDDELYGFFLRQNVYTAYPITEPSMYEHPWKFEAVYQMAEGIRKFRASTMVEKIPSHTLHLMVAEKDQYIPREVMDRFWDIVPESARASRVIVLGSEHKIPEDKPQFAAKWVNQIMLGTPQLFEGRTFEATAKN